MNLSCKLCKDEFIFSGYDQELLAKLAPTFLGTRREIPAPTLCPACRRQRRLAHRNERQLYRRKCDKSGKNIVSIFSPDKPFPVYAHSVWWDDSWDAKDFGKDIDFNRPFFEQMKEMRDLVPRIPSLSKDSENSDYTNHSANNKNCYFAVGVFGSEDVYYSRKVFSSKSIIDSLFIFNQGELLYECFWGRHLYNCRHCIFCSTCSDLAYCYDCRSCRNCFMSSNLRGKEYVYKNKQLTKAEYQKKLNSIDLGSYQVSQQLLEEFKTLRESSINPPTRLENCEDVSGDLLINCKNCTEFYCGAFAENCRHCVETDRATDGRGSYSCMDCFGLGDSELVYEVQGQVNGYHNLFCNWSYDVSNSIYLDMCFNVSNCFGCVGLHGHEKYCILNKQYSKDEYEQLCTKLIDHMSSTSEWGEFFPGSYSPVGYNETLAMDFSPIDSKEAERLGYWWSSFEPPPPNNIDSIDAAELPDSIKDVSDEILNHSIYCAISRKPFRIVKTELEFYKKNNHPLPRIHPDQRYLTRINNRNPLQLWDRTCAKSGEPISTSFSPQRPEVVYCEQHYLDSLRS